MIKPEAYSAVVLLHTPDEVLLQERPNIPGKLAYPGQLQFLGGGRNQRGEVLESAIDAAVRELDEETNIGNVDPGVLREQWAGVYQGLDRHGNATWRHVTLFRLGLTAIKAHNLKLSEKEGKGGGQLVHLKRSPEVIDTHQDSITPFALARLREFVKSGDGSETD